MANAIESGLLVDAMSDAILETMTAESIALKDITTFDASTDQSAAGVIHVPFVNTSSVSAATFSGTYTNGDADLDDKAVTMSESFVEFGFNGAEQQSNWIPQAQRIAASYARVLVSDVETACYATITSGNYAAEEVVASAAAMTGDIAGTLRTALSNANVPNPRSLVLDPDYCGGLIADISDASAFGSADPAQNGMVGMVRGLKGYESNNLPAAIKGFASGNNALIVATRGCYSEMGIYDVHEVVQDEKTGLVFTIRRYADGSKGSHRWILSIRYGVAVGDAGALTRIVAS